MSDKKTAAYIRISTDKKQKIDSQLADVEEYCSNHGIEATFYVDEGFTGNDTERPEFQRLQEDVFKGRINKIIISRLNRISRKAADGMKIFEDWLDKDIEVISVNESMSFEGATGKLTRQLLQILSEWDQSVRRESALKGIAIAKEKHPEKYAGRKMGAYSVDGDKILELRAKRFSMAKIADMLKVSENTVQNHVDRNAVNDIEEALERMVKQKDMLGKFELKLSFHDGLTGNYSFNGVDNVIPSPTLKGLMKSSKKWFAIHADDNLDHYKKLMTELVSLWDDNWFSFHLSEEDVEDINPNDLMKEAEMNVSNEDKHKEMDDRLKEEGRIVEFD